MPFATAMSIFVVGGMLPALVGTPGTAVIWSAEYAHAQCFCRWPPGILVLRGQDWSDYVVALAPSGTKQGLIRLIHSPLISAKLSARAPLDPRLPLPSLRNPSHVAFATYRDGCASTRCRIHSRTSEQIIASASVSVIGLGGGCLLLRA